MRTITSPSPFKGNISIARSLHASICSIQGIANDVSQSLPGFQAFCDLDFDLVTR